MFHHDEFPEKLVHPNNSRNRELCFIIPCFSIALV